MKDLVETLKKIKITADVYKALPETPGVYIFLKNEIPIYVGKAINLKRRVSSYFDIDLQSKTASMMNSANFLSYIKVNSELESLLLEAKLIRKYMPHYNIISKDDKHPLYIVITKEQYPRILSVRKLEAVGPNSVSTSHKNLIASFGPFPSSRNVFSVLRMLRRIFPFSDHKLGRRKCIYSHIGLCNPCPNVIENVNDKLQMTNMRKSYLKNVRNIKLILEGEIESLKNGLEKEMKFYSAKEEFEKAKQIRDQIEKLEYITRPQIPTDYFMQNPNLYEDVRSKELRELKNLLTGGTPVNPIVIKDLHRIECFDIAHLAGTNPTASMVTFVNGEADKTFYRHFKIRKAKGGDDYESMREVSKRRVKHFDDWGKPDLIIVDGGLGQVAAFSSEIQGIPVVGIAKHPDRLIIGKEKIRLAGAPLNLVSRMRDEAHRFARRLHHKQVSKQLINS